MSLKWKSCHSTFIHNNNRPGMFIISLITENLWTSWYNPITEEWFNGDPRSSQVSQKRRVIGIGGVVVSPSWTGGEILIRNWARWQTVDTPRQWRAARGALRSCWAPRPAAPPGLRLSARPLPGPFPLWDSQEQAAHIRLARCPPLTLFLRL